MTRKLWLAVSLATGALQAQTPKPAVVSVSASARWEPWLGCWSAEGQGQANTLTCIVPSADNAGVERLAVAGGSVTSREALVADGRPRPIEKDGCKGEQNASFSKTGSRVYLSGHFTCAGNTDVGTSSLYAIAPGGDWLEDEQVQSGGGSVMHETRYRDAGLPATLPKSVASALQGRGMVIASARAAASVVPTFADVTDASAFVDSSLVRAWLVQSGARLGGTTVFAQASGPYAYGSGNVFYGPNYPPGVTATESNSTMQPAGLTPYCIPTGCYLPNPAAPYGAYVFYPSTYSMDGSSFGYGYPLAYGYPYGYGLWSGPVIFAPGAGRPRVPKPWGLGTQPTAPHPRPVGHPGIRG